MNRTDTASSSLVNAGVVKTRRRGSGEQLRRVLAAVLPPLVAGLLVIIVWYIAGTLANLSFARTILGTGASDSAVFQAALNLNAPWVPLPHQVLSDFFNGLAQPLDSPRGLWLHMGVTAGEAGLGLALGTVVGIIIATIFVHSRPLEAAFLPFVVASQTIPVIALAPIVIGILGISLAAKVVVAAYLVFFSVTVSMVKGFKSVDPLAYDLMRSYAASPWQIYRKVRFPVALPYLFTGVKVGATASLVGAIIAELPFGSTTGIGARLLVATTYSETIVWWSTMLAAAVLGVVIFTIINLLERLILPRRPRAEEL